VHEVPRLVPQPAPHGDGRGDRDGDDQREPGDRRDDAWIAGDQPRDLVRQRDPVPDGVAGRDQHRVRAEQREHREAADPVPGHEPVEAHQAVEHGQAGEQQQLQEHDVRAQQPGQAAEPREQTPGVVDVADPARPPQRDHDRRVGGGEQHQAPAGDPATACAHGAKSTCALLRSA
jgi:hypothetical protein